MILLANILYVSVSFQTQQHRDNKDFFSNFEVLCMSQIYLYFLFHTSDIHLFSIDAIAIFNLNHD